MLKTTIRLSALLALGLSQVAAYMTTADTAATAMHESSAHEPKSVDMNFKDNCGTNTGKVAHPMFRVTFSRETAVAMVAFAMDMGHM